ncbi:hypothetical protein E4U45_002750 [Claviceps purpurea]|nr:hypothetical protein E4U45_002750 [Claviceps purpurea]
MAPDEAFQADIEVDGSARRIRAGTPEPTTLHVAFAFQRHRCITIGERLATDYFGLTPRQKWIHVIGRLADSVKKRLARYFETGQVRGLDPTAFLQYLVTLYASS